MYRRLISNVVTHLDPTPHAAHNFLRDWDIRLHPLSQTDETFFEHTVSTSGAKLNTGQPSGVTGDHQMDLFLHDEPKMRHFQENADRTQHEVGHAKLIGTPDFVSGVHNKISPAGSYLKSFKFMFWTNRWKFWQRIPITVIDVREEITLSKQ